MKKLTANFYPAAEEKNGYLGKANITIADAIRLNGISVFRSDDGGIHINFPEFGEGGSYIVPKSKEAYAAMRDVVAKAVESEKHFGFTAGKYGPNFEVHAKMVDEPFADTRFRIDVDDICALYGVKSRVVDYEKDDGKTHSFVAVDYPTIGSFENAAGEIQYRRAFEGRISGWKDQNGEEHSIDYSQRLNGMIRSERDALMKDRKPALDAQMRDAQNRTEQVDNREEVPIHEVMH